MKTRRGPYDPHGLGVTIFYELQPVLVRQDVTTADRQRELSRLTPTQRGEAVWPLLSPQQRTWLIEVASTAYGACSPWYSVLVAEE